MSAALSRSRVTAGPPQGSRLTRSATGFMPPHLDLHTRGSVGPPDMFAHGYRAGVGPPNILASPHLGHRAGVGPQFDRPCSCSSATRRVSGRRTYSPARSSARTVGSPHMFAGPQLMFAGPSSPSAGASSHRDMFVEPPTAVTEHAGASLDPADHGAEIDRLREQGRWSTLKKLATAVGGRLVGAGITVAVLKRRKD